MRIIGLDPGLRVTGWGIIDQNGNRLSPVAHGTVKTDASLPLAQRLVQLEKGLVKVIAEHGPDEAAVEDGGKETVRKTAYQSPQQGHHVTFVSVPNAKKRDHVVHRLLRQHAHAHDARALCDSHDHPAHQP